MRYYSAMTVFECLAVLVLAVQAASNSMLCRRSKRDIIASAVLIFIATLCEYLGVRLDGADPSLTWLHRVVKFLELTFAPAIPAVFGAAIYPPKKRYGLEAALVLHMLIELASMFVGITYYIDAQNVYVHCRFYWLYYLAYAFGVLFMIERVIQFTRAYQNQNRVGLAGILGYVLLGIAWQAFDVNMRVVWLSVSIGVILFYNYFCNLLQQIDPLTTLLNRRSFENRMGDRRIRGVLLIADVNDFKQVNDRYGHRYGDQCLTRLGTALKEIYGKYGLCYRIGGDEFAMVLWRAPESVEALNAQLERRLKDRQRQDPRLPDVSVGYARIDDEHLSPEEALEWADHMMYGHKARKKRG